jgi:hypothetical protein
MKEKEMKKKEEKKVKRIKKEKIRMGEMTKMINIIINHKKRKGLKTT